jgi:hypothetical protein
MKSFYYEIEPYSIHASGYDLTVVPLTDGAYRVINPGGFVADLYPEITAAGIFWNGFGLLSAGLADEIGSQIYAYEV